MQNEPLSEALHDPELVAARERQAEAWQKVFDAMADADVGKLIAEAQATAHDVRSAINAAHRRVIAKYGEQNKKTRQVGSSRLAKLLGPPSVNAKGISRSALHALESVRLG